MITNVAELYDLSQLQLAGLPRLGEKSAAKLIQAIQNSKQTTLERFIFALGIRDVGESTARNLVQHFVDFAEIMQASTDDLSEVKDVGNVVATSIVAFFKDKHNIQVITKLLKAGIIWQKAKTIKNNLPLQDQIFVLTGNLSNFSRDVAKDKLQNLGAVVSSSLSKNTDFLVLGEKPGSKLEKAKKLNIKILTEDDFLKLLNQYE